MILPWLRSCAHCSGCLGRVDLFCEACWESLFTQLRFEESHAVNPQFLTTSLWRWGPKTPLVECFVRSQKSCTLRQARERIVSQYLSFFPRERPASICCVVSDLRKTDHGPEWAKAFSKATGRPYFLLQLSDQSRHKQKGRKQRYQERHVLPPQKAPRNRQNCWFIDDVVTTGATAKAVWVALNKPKGFRAVALVYRAPPSTSE